MKYRNHPQFDFGSNGSKERDAGIESVLSHTPPSYQFLEGLAFWFLVETYERFTAEDARPMCGDPPNHPNAFSGNWYWLAAKAKELGLVEEIAMTKTRRKTSHRRKLPIYLGVRPGARIPPLDL